MINRWQTWSLNAPRFSHYLTPVPLFPATEKTNEKNKNSFIGKLRWNTWVRRGGKKQTDKGRPSRLLGFHLVLLKLKLARELNLICKIDAPSMHQWINPTTGHKILLSYDIADASSIFLYLFFWVFFGTLPPMTSNRRKPLEIGHEFVDVSRR